LSAVRSDKEWRKGANPPVKNQGEDFHSCGTLLAGFHGEPGIVVMIFQVSEVGCQKPETGNLGTGFVDSPPTFA
jgi:hypothetical protein